MFGVVYGVGRTPNFGFRVTLAACLLIAAVLQLYWYLNEEHGDRIFLYQHTHDESQVARVLREQVRVFCLILTAKKYTFTRTVHVNATWAPHCNKYVFVTPDPESKLPSLDLNVTDHYDYLWGKTKAAFRWVHDHELDHFDWFLKADDDTFVVMENLRLLLLSYSSSDPLYLGCRFDGGLAGAHGYMAGGPGYVLSREAVRRLYRVLPDASRCSQSEKGIEDVEMGKCLAGAGVRAGDSRDYLKRHRFLPVQPNKHLHQNRPDFMTPGYMWYPNYQGKDCCSPYVISFHYVDPQTMYVLENLLYRLRPVGAIDDFWLEEMSMQKKLRHPDRLKHRLKKLSLSYVSGSNLENT